MEEEEEGTVGYETDVAYKRRVVEGSRAADVGAVATPCAQTGEIALC